MRCAQMILRMITTLGLLSLGGCNKSPISPTVGSETHWLQACDSSAECGEENACVCGICTAPCQADSCATAGPAAVCLAPDAPGAVALCGALPANATGICAQGCGRPADCGAGLTCEAQTCVPAIDEAAPLPRRISQRTTALGGAQVDLLFVIDDSGSMCQEQDALSQAFEQISGEFADVDYRIAVTSTDAQVAQPGLFIAEPTDAVPSLNCRDENDQPFLPITADCPALLGGLDDPALIRADLVANETMLRDWFRCLVTLGTGGDGFESGLNAAVRATRCDGPNAARFSACCDGDTFDPTCQQPGPAPDFLRPDAPLVVVFLTDENDCTAGDQLPALSQFPVCQSTVDADDDGVPDGYATHCGGDVGAAACYAEDCQDLAIADCAEALCTIARSENSNCEWDRDRLVPPERVAEALAGLKRDANDVTVWAYAGPELRTLDGDPVRFDRGEPDEICAPALDDVEACCPNGRCVGPVEPTCESVQGSSSSGHRYGALAQTVVGGCGPEDGCSICADQLDFSGAGGRLAAQRHGACLSARPGCFIDAALTPCPDADSRADPENYALRAELDGAEMQRGADWILTAEPACPSGLRFEATNPEDLPVNASIQLRYAR